MCCGLFINNISFSNKLSNDLTALDSAYQRQKATYTTSTTKRQKGDTPTWCTLHLFKWLESSNKGDFIRASSQKYRCPWYNPNAYKPEGDNQDESPVGIRKEPRLLSIWDPTIYIADNIRSTRGVNKLVAMMKCMIMYIWIVCVVAPAILTIIL